MSNSQNNKNEQQNNLCTTLTEQWKKGKLDRDRYYIKYRGNYVSDNWHGDCWEDSWSEYVEEVLAPVPSYEEWHNAQEQLHKDGIWYTERSYKELKKENKQLRKWCEEFNALDVAKENQQLKELLKECRTMLGQFEVHNPRPRSIDVIEMLIRIDNKTGEK